MKEYDVVVIGSGTAGQTAANLILGETDDRVWPQMDYSAVPAILFTYPQ